MKPTTARLSALWQLSRLRPDERRIASWLTVAVGVFLIGWLLIATEDQYAQLSRRLPQAEAQLLKMKHEANELLSLTARPEAGSISIEQRLEALGNDAKAHGLAIKLELGGNVLTISGEAPADRLLVFLADAQNKYGFRPRQVNLRTIGTLLTVKAELEDLLEIP